MAEKMVMVDLGDDGRLAILAEQHGPQPVGDKDIMATLAALTGPISRVGREVLDAAKSAKPTKATVEVAFGVTVEGGQLVALFGKPKGEATVTLVLEWAESTV